MPVSAANGVGNVGGSDLAWLLADEIAGSLPDSEKAVVFTDLGSGDFWSAIAHLLSVAERDRRPVSAVLLAELAVWLDGYSGSIEELLMRELLARVPGRAW